VRCSWRRSYGTRRGTRFARVHGAILSDPPQQNAIRQVAMTAGCRIAIRITPAVLCFALTRCARYEFVPMPASDCPKEVVAPLQLSAITPTQADRLILRVGSTTPVPYLADVWLEVSSRVRNERVGLDSSATFRLRGPSGQYVISTRRIGYKSRTDTIVLTDSSTLGITVPLRVMLVDECPGIAMVPVRRPWWKFW
jgi:hypothetical protein